MNGALTPALVNAGGFGFIAFFFWIILKDTLREKRRLADVLNNHLKRQEEVQREYIEALKASTGAMQETVWEMRQCRLRWEQSPMATRYVESPPK